MPTSIYLIKDNIDESIANFFRIPSSITNAFVGLAFEGKNIEFTFIIEYSSLRDFGRQ
jgi:hypothetical protein